MKRTVIFAFAALLSAHVAIAGGYLTNTNQSVAFLRQPARNATIGVDGAYFNPAGITFLSDGWQLGFGMQNIHQTRQIESTFAPFAYNGGSETKKYKGTTNVPVLPNLDLCFVHGKWSGSFHFGVIGGGGKADFPDGLASLESAIAMIPAVINTVAGSSVLTGYDADISMLGKQYNFSGQLNVGYQVNDHLGIAVGARLVYAVNHFEAAIGNIRLQPAGGSLVPAGAALGGVFSALGLPAGYASAADALVSDKNLDAGQKGFGILPIVSVDYRTGRFNFAARYEFNCGLKLKNSTTANTTGLPQYDDGLKVANDMPAMLALGGEYSITDALRLSLGYNRYFDKQSKVYNPATGKDDKTDLIAHNSYEFLAGVEWDLSEKFTVSMGGQVTRFGWGKDMAFISDQSFNPDSFSLGAGVRYNINSRLSIDAAVFNTFYEHAVKQMDDYNGVGATLGARLAPLATAIPALANAPLQVPGSDRLYRTSFVAGIGVNYKIR